MEIKTRITDKFAVHAEIDAHHAEAAKTFKNPVLVGTTNGAPEDDTPGPNGEQFLTIVSTWKEGPEPTK